MQDLAVEEMQIERIPAVEAIAYESDILQDAAMPSTPQYRSEAQVLVFNGLDEALAAPIPATAAVEKDLGQREMTFSERYATAKVKASIRRDMETAKRNNENPRDLLLLLSNYEVAA